MLFAELPNGAHRQIPQMKTKHTHTHIHSFRDLCCHLVKKLTLGLLVPITLEVVPSTHMYCFQHSCHFFNTSWKSCSICLDHLSCVRMAAFQFYLQSVKQRKLEPPP
jgi:hypothetical protein